MIRISFVLMMLGFNAVQALAAENNKTLFPAVQPGAGTLTIYSTTDLVAIKPLIEDFQKSSPDVSID